MPDTPEYLARIRASAQGKDPLALQRETPTTLAELISKAPGSQLTTRPSDNKWSVGEILAHMAESEIATAWRYRQMVEHSGLELPGYDQEMWAQVGDYAVRQPQDSLALFRLLRLVNLQFLEQLAPRQWDCFGIHAERGRITVKELATHMAGHDINHIAQIRTILS
jgi:uncharacterized damage-inducible protein DinB